jgi:integrase
VGWRLDARSDHRRAGNVLPPSEMLRIQNRHVDWERHQIAIPGAHAKDAENRRVPFDPQGRLAPVLMRRAKLGASAFVFGGPEGEYQDSFKTAWESLLLGSPRASVWGSSRGFAPRLRKRARQDSNLRPSA